MPFNGKRNVLDDLIRLDCALCPANEFVSHRKVARKATLSCAKANTFGKAMDGIFDIFRVGAWLLELLLEKIGPKIGVMMCLE